MAGRIAQIRRADDRARPFEPARRDEADPEPGPHEVGDPGTVRYLVRAELGISLVPASWLERPGPVVGAADLRDAPRHRLSLLTPAAGGSPAGRLLLKRLLEL